MTENKYASVLDGLTIEDPVESFFAFCRERESIRNYEKVEDHLHGVRIQYFKRGDFLMFFVKMIGVVKQYYVLLLA